MPMKQTATFIETMDCLPVSKLPEGPEWTYEIKLNGYRLEVVRSAGKTTLYSRRQNVLNQKFHYIATALKDLPEDTGIQVVKVKGVYRGRKKKLGPEKGERL